jgi:hypothetical protein
MTRNQAIHCMHHSILVEDKDDEDYKTGIITSVSPYTDHAAVSWDTNHDGEIQTVELRYLVVQYPGDLEPHAEDYFDHVAALRRQGLNQDGSSIRRDIVRRPRDEQEK